MSLRRALLPLCLLAALPALADARGFDVRDLVKLDRVSSPTLSPDGHVVVFAQRSVDADLKATTALYARNLLTRDMAPPKRITPEGWNVNSPAFSPDGKTVYFLSAKNGSQQLYAIPAAGGTPRQLTAFALDVGSYQLSPDLPADVTGGLGDYLAAKLGWSPQQIAASDQRLQTLGLYLVEMMR